MECSSGVRQAVILLVVLSLSSALSAVRFVETPPDMSIRIISPAPDSEFFLGERINVKFSIEGFDFELDKIFVVAFLDDDAEEEALLRGVQFGIDGLGIGIHTLNLMVVQQDTRRTKGRWRGTIRASVKFSVIAAPIFSSLVQGGYEQYKELQLGHWCTLESDHAKWKLGQQRFVEQMFGEVPKTSSILDIACGDGVGLRVFRDLGFENVVGVEFNPAKVELARTVGYRVLEADLHNVPLDDESFDIVYSSHTLEHAFWPDLAALELRRLLKPNGTLVLVLPYPELQGSENTGAHGAKFELGLHVQDEAATLVSFFESRSLQLLHLQFDSFRENEVWLQFRKLEDPAGHAHGP